MNLGDLRQDYKRNRLDEADSGDDPVVFFRKWLDEAIQADISEPTAMSLSTVSSAGKPSSRIVLLKSIEHDQFVFFTNYESMKGEHLKLNPHASLLFFWPQLERQVRIEGTVTKTDRRISDLYFLSRPFESRLSALVSPQSRVISCREELEKLVDHAAEKFGTAEISRPDYWGGFLVNPETIEFWQGRPGRLHDRIRYRKKSEGDWSRERLAP